MTNSAKAFRLPPLILHPFSSPEDTSVLMESSRASLALQGFLPRDETPAQDLDKQLLRGRYAELRMLYYIGKDVSRWTEQCAETVLASADFEGRNIRPETFAVLLVQHIPAHVRLKIGRLGGVGFLRALSPFDWVACRFSGDSQGRRFLARVSAAVSPLSGPMV